MRLPETEEEKIMKLSPSDRKSLRDSYTEKIKKSKSDWLLVLSGAGTGKTYLFSEIVKKWIDNGIEAEDILVTSFINFIVNDLKISLPRGCSVLTLHKLSKRIIHKYLDSGGTYIDEIRGDFSVATPLDEEILIQDIFWLLNEKISKRTIKEEIGVFLANPTKPPSFFKYYKGLTRLYNLVTFQDMILRASKSLDVNPRLINFKKMIVDEFQDFNEAEQGLVNRIFKRSSGGVIAGDDDQSIYSSLKKADPAGIIRKHKNAKWESHSLPFCSRTRSASVVHSSIEIVRNQKNQRIDKSYLPLEDNGNKIVLAELSKSEKGYLIEAEYIASQIDTKKLDQWDKDYPLYMIIGKGSKHLAALTTRVSEILERDLDTKKDNVYNNLELILLISYLKLYLDPSHNLSYRRILHISNRKDKKALLQGVYYAAGTFDYPMSDFAKQIRGLREKIKIVDEDQLVIEEKLKQIADILGLNKNNDAIRQFIEKNKSKKSIGEIFEDENDEIIDAKEKERENMQRQPIQFLTIWGSKGLKAENVFVVGLEEGYLPKDNSNIEDEEMRLMYVAMTRAVESLTLIRCIVRTDGIHQSMGSIGGYNKKESAFISLIDNNKLNRQKIKRADLKK